jgi:hypothetical protein
MLPTEIRDKIMSGEIGPDEARAMFEAARASKGIVEHKTPHPMPMKRPPMGQMDNREQLAMIRPDLARGLVQVDAQHFYKRMLIEENARNIVAVPAYAIIGVIAGLLDSVGYGASERIEDITFGVTRCIYRAGDGIRRGKL